MAKIKKQSDETFGIYVAELSMGELKAVQKALALHHSDAVADELFQAINFYLDRLPAPGQSKDAAKAEVEQQEASRADSLLPAPPSDEEPTSGEEPSPAAEPDAPPAEPEEGKATSYEELMAGGPDAGLPAPPEIPAE